MAAECNRNRLCIILAEDVSMQACWERKGLLGKERHDAGGCKQREVGYREGHALKGLGRRALPLEIEVRSSRAQLGCRIVQPMGLGAGGQGEQVCCIQELRAASRVSASSPLV
jgi:hypothetical protein